MVVVDEDRGETTREEERIGEGEGRRGELRKREGEPKVSQSLWALRVDKTLSLLSSKTRGAINVPFRACRLKATRAYDEKETEQNRQQCEVPWLEDQTLLARHAGRGRAG